MNITHENIIELILDSESRSDLFKAIALQNDNSLSIENAVSNAILNLKAIDESQIIQIKDILLEEGNIGERILSNFVSERHFPEQLLYELLDKNKCISALCHKREPIDFLLKLIENDDCSEAVITIGKHYYRSPDVSNSDFADYIEKYKAKYLLLSSLIHILDLKNQKTDIFIDILKTSNYKNELTKLCSDLIAEKKLAVTEDIAWINETASTGNPRFLRAISRNYHTPTSILQKLSTVEKIKYAKAIRHNAINNLRNRH